MENNIKKHLDQTYDRIQNMVEKELISQLAKRGIEFKSNFSLYEFLSKSVIKSSGPELDIYYLKTESDSIELFRVSKTMKIDDDGATIKVTIS